MKNILILDDDEDTLFLYRSILKKKEWQIDTLQHCNNIIENIEKYNPQLIIIDNSLPDEGGLSAAKKIKAHTSFKNIPILFSSANHGIEAIAKSAGADGYLKKPFDIAGLKEQVEKFIK